MGTPERPSNGSYERILCWAGVLCIALTVGLWIGPYALRDDLFSDDAAHHIFWFYQYTDASLFPNDLMVQYFRTSAPVGYRLFYATVARLTDVLSAAEWLSMGLLALSGYLAWKLGEAMDESRRALRGLLAVVAMAILLRYSMEKDLLPSIAFQRSVSLPLMLLCLWALVRRQYAWVGISWVFAGLVYPVLLPVMGMTAAIVFVRDMVTERRMPAQWVFNGLCGLAALALAIFGIPGPGELGPAYSYTEAMTMPEFGEGGRLQMYRPDLLGYWIMDGTTGFGWAPRVLVLLAIALGFVLVLGRRRLIPFAAWVMAAVGTGLWLAMRLFPDELMFGLYLPNRHSRWAIAAFGIVVLAAAGDAVVTALLNLRAFRSDTWKVRISYAAAIAAPALIAAVMLPRAADIWLSPVDTDLERAYAYIARLPSDTLVAAHPDLANFVPLRARHSVLTSTEASMAWFAGYYAKVKPRVVASLRAAYAVDISDVDRELAPYGVNIVLTGPSVWSTTTYHEPFNRLVQQLLEDGRQRGFALKNPPSDRVLFRSGEYYVLEVHGAGSHEH